VSIETTQCGLILLKHKEPEAHGNNFLLLPEPGLASPFGWNQWSTTEHFTWWGSGVTISHVAWLTTRCWGIGGS